MDYETNLDENTGGTKHLKEFRDERGVKINKKVLTPDFYEFAREITAKASELVHLIQGLAYEKKFNLTPADHATQNYRHIKFWCSSSDLEGNKEKGLFKSKCPFYLEFIAHTSAPNSYRMTGFYEFHNHDLKKNVKRDLKKWWDQKGKERKTVAEAKWKNRINSNKIDWKREFQSSLTYELSSVYAAQIISQKDTLEKEKLEKFGKGSAIEAATSTAVKKTTKDSGTDAKSSLTRKSHFEKMSTMTKKTGFLPNQRVLHPDLEAAGLLGLDQTLYFDRNALLDPLRGSDKI